MRKRFLALMLVLAVSSSPGVVHAADRQYLSPDPGSDTAQGTAPSGFTVEEVETIPTGKPTDFSGLTISLPVRADLELNNDETAYTVEDYVEIKGDLSYTKYITATATAEYTSPDGKVKKTPTVNHESVDFKWSASQVLAAKDTADHRAFDISIPSKEVERYAGTWDGHIDFTFNIETVSDTHARVIQMSAADLSYDVIAVEADVIGSSAFNKHRLYVTFDRPVKCVNTESHVSYIAGDGTDTLQFDYSGYFNGYGSSVSHITTKLWVCPVDDLSDLEVLNAELIVEPSFI